MIMFYYCSACPLWRLRIPLISSFRRMMLETFSFWRLALLSVPKEPVGWTQSSIGQWATRHSLDPSRHPCWALHRDGVFLFKVPWRHWSCKFCSTIWCSYPYLCLLLLPIWRIYASLRHNTNANMWYYIRLFDLLLARCFLWCIKFFFLLFPYEYLGCLLSRAFALFPLHILEPTALLVPLVLYRREERVRKSRKKW